MTKEANLTSAERYHAFRFAWPLADLSEQQAINRHIQEAHPDVTDKDAIWEERLRHINALAFGRSLLVIQENPDQATAIDPSSDEALLRELLSQNPQQ